MNKAFPLWVFLAVAVAIAVVGFAVGQVVTGGGMIFVLAATLGWVTFVQAHQRRMMK